MQNTSTPSYQMLIDWNGDIFMSSRLARGITMGNLMQKKFLLFGVIKL